MAFKVVLARISSALQRSPVYLRRTGILASLVGLLILFQNCGGGFKAYEGFDLSSAAANLPGGLDPDDEPMPTPDIPMTPVEPLSVSVRNTEGRGGGDFVFKVELNKTSSTPVTVGLKTVAGSALPFVDYEHLETSLTVPAGELTAQITVKGIFYEAATRAKQFSLQATASSPGTLIKQSIGTAVIKPTQQVLNFKQVSAGALHTCAITMSDTVKCWGNNAGGQLGNNSNESSSVPVDVVGLTGVKQISSAYGNSCALMGDDTVKCWGLNNYGQLGIEPGAEQRVPIDMPGAVDIAKIYTSIEKTCLLSKTGSVYCTWFERNTSQIAVFQTGPTPTLKLEPKLTGIKQLALETSVFCVLTGDNAVKCRGTDLPSGAVPVNVPELAGVKQLTAGDQFCAIMPNETVKCWRVGPRGEPRDFVDIAGLAGAKQVYDQYRRSCALLETGNYKCWGTDAHLITGKPANPLVATEAESLSGLRELSIGERRYCGITPANTLKCAGSNFDGTLGNNTKANAVIPVRASGMSGMKQYLSGPAGTECFITASDTVKCAGKNDAGQLGNNSKVDSVLPVDVLGLSGVKQIVVGNFHVCALMDEGNVKCWGSNVDGKLGNNSTVNSPVPVEVAGLAGVKQIAGAYNSICAITANDTVKCWGNNYDGILGNNSMVSSPVPVDVVGLTDVKRISAGYRHFCALLTGGTVSCWGGNGFFQLGRNRIERSLVPIAVEDLVGVKELSAGGYFNCAIAADDSVKCWGSNHTGTLGKDPVVSSFAPLSIGGLTGVTNIRASYYNVCTVRPDKTAKCWGSYGIYETLGNTLRDVKEVFAGLSTSLLAIHSDGSISRVGALLVESRELLEVTAPLP